MAYQLNDYINLSGQYLHGSQISSLLTSRSPSRPPLLGGQELAPVPMRLRVERLMNASDEVTVRKVLSVDGFEIQSLSFNNNVVSSWLKTQNLDRRRKL